MINQEHENYDSMSKKKLSYLMVFVTAESIPLKN